jgi:hypothetical protein
MHANRSCTTCITGYLAEVKIQQEIMEKRFPTVASLAHVNPAY